MDSNIFKLLEFVRNNTLKAVEGITEEQGDYIPDGFRNNIRWHLGHIYLYLERFAFLPNDLPMNLPDDFMKDFANGTSPADWSSATPALQEIITLLKEQPNRVRLAFEERLDNQVVKPFIHPSGIITLETVRELLSFNLYHEGMHLNSIKNFKALYNR